MRPRISRVVIRTLLVYSACDELLISTSLRNTEYVVSRPNYPFSVIPHIHINIKTIDLVARRRALSITYRGLGESYRDSYFFPFCVTGQPASANDVQGIRLHKPPKMKL